MVAQIVNGHHVKPKDWYSRKDEQSNEIHDACTIECIPKINKDKLQGKEPEVHS